MFKSKSQPPAFSADFSGSLRTPVAYKASRLAVDELGLSGDITALAVDPVGGLWAVGASLPLSLPPSRAGKGSQAVLPRLVLAASLRR